MEVCFYTLYKEGNVTIMYKGVLSERSSSCNWNLRFLVLEFSEAVSCYPFQSVVPPEASGLSGARLVVFKRNTYIYSIR